MKKILAIGDIHGRDDWKRVVEKADWDICVFVGDYFDSYDLSPNIQLVNFLDIVDFKKKNKDKVILLTGNHDLHYMLPKEQYSGYQETYAHRYKWLLEAAKPLMKRAYEYHGLLFTHAGVTESWAMQHGVATEHIASEINLLPLEAFAFSSRQPYDPYGDAIHQGPMWVRPRSLKKDAIKGYTQIVGHTQVEAITDYTDTIKLIDSPESGEYLVIKVTNNKYEFDIRNVGI